MLIQISRILSCNYRTADIAPRYPAWISVSGISLSQAKIDQVFGSSKRMLSRHPTVRQYGQLLSLWQ